MVSSWSDAEREHYSPSDDQRLAIYYEHHGIGEDPADREKFLLGHYALDRKIFYGLAWEFLETQDVDLHNIAPVIRAIALTSLENKIISDMDREGVTLDAGKG